jgi:hypothetical protein
VGAALHTLQEHQKRTRASTLAEYQKQTARAGKTNLYGIQEDPRL